MKKSDQLFSEIISHATLPLMITRDDQARIRRSSAQSLILSKFERCYRMENLTQRYKCSLETMIAEHCPRQSANFSKCLQKQGNLSKCYISISDTPSTGNNTIDSSSLTRGSNPQDDELSSIASTINLKKKRMEYVSKCITKIKRLSLRDRNKLERKTLQSLIDSEKKMVGFSQQQMIVESSWVDRYKDYLQRRSIDLKRKHLNGPIDNKPVVKKARKGVLKDRDYYKLSEDIYKLIEGIYGGGPEVSESQLKRIIHETNVSDSKENTNITDMRMSSLTIKTKKSVSERFDNKKRKIWRPAEKIIFSPESTLQYKHSGDKAVSSMSSWEDSDEEMEVKVNKPEKRDESKEEEKKRYNTPKKQKSQKFEESKSGVDPMIQSMLEFSTKKKQKVDKKKITYREKDKKVLLEFSKKFYNNLKLDVDKKEPQRHFDQLRTRKYSPDSQTNRNGFENEMVYCYLNAVMQCILSVPYFIHLIENPGDFGKSIKKSKKFSYHFKKAIEANSSRDLGVVNITDMLILFKKYIDLELQQDAHEFMRLLLEKIHEELKPKFDKKKKKNYKYNWDNFKVNEVSPVSVCFAGELTRKTMCFNCFEINENRESFFELSLSVEEHFETLEDSLKEYFLNELIDDDYECEKCKKRAPASSKIFLSKLPRILTIHLKRFSYFPTHQKLRYELPPEHGDALDLSPFTGGALKGAYSLVGTIVHSGNISNGHYTACSKREGKWYFFDDDDVYQTSLEKVLAREPYIMIYELVDAE